MSNKPTIPAAANDAMLNIQRNGTSVGTFTANASTNKTINIAVPTNVSELGNDAHYVSNAGCASVNLCDLATDLAQLNATLAALNNTIDSLRDRIEELEVQHAVSSAVFDLGGRKVADSADGIQRLPKGVYIVNGKKVVR